jgi:hypothetical protein
MMWVVSGFLASYLAVCEVRAPTPWEMCDKRWNFAAGVFCPSPLVELAKQMQARKRDDWAPPPGDPPVTGGR